MLVEKRPPGGGGVWIELRVVRAACVQRRIAGGTRDRLADDPARRPDGEGDADRRRSLRRRGRRRDRKCGGGFRPPAGPHRRRGDIDARRAPRRRRRRAAASCRASCALRRRSAISCCLRFLARLSWRVSRRWRRRFSTMVLSAACGGAGFGGSAGSGTASGATTCGGGASIRLAFRWPARRVAPAELRRRHCGGLDLRPASSGPRRRRPAARGSLRRRRAATSAAGWALNVDKNQARAAARIAAAPQAAASPGGPPPRAVAKGPRVERTPDTLIFRRLRGRRAAFAAPCRAEMSCRVR